MPQSIERGEQYQAEDTAERIVKVCNGLAGFLVRKNRNCGNNALEPVRVFSRTHAGGQILRDIDETLRQIRDSGPLEFTDVMCLAGDLVLLILHQGWDERLDEMVDEEREGDQTEEEDTPAWTGAVKVSEVEGGPWVDVLVDYGSAEEMILDLQNPGNWMERQGHKTTLIKVKGDKWEVETVLFPDGRAWNSLLRGFRQ